MHTPESKSLAMLLNPSCIANRLKSLEYVFEIMNIATKWLKVVSISDIQGIFVHTINLGQ